MKPDRYLDPFGDPVEAVRWQPDVLIAAGTCIGWLMSSDADFHHGEAADGATTLAIRRGNGRPDVTAQPGDWVVRKQRPLLGAVFAVVRGATFESFFTADTATYRTRTAEEATR